VALGVEQLDVSAVLLDQAADDREPETTALAAPVPPEAVEGALSLFGPQAGAFVPDP
jgi:hypothetical protein